MRYPTFDICSEVHEMDNDVLVRRLDAEGIMDDIPMVYAMSSYDFTDLMDLCNKVFVPKLVEDDRSISPLPWDDGTAEGEVIFAET